MSPYFCLPLCGVSLEVIITPSSSVYIPMHIKDLLVGSMGQVEWDNLGYCCTIPPCIHNICQA